MMKNGLKYFLIYIILLSLLMDMYDLIQDNDINDNNFYCFLMTAYIWSSKCL